MRSLLDAGVDEAQRPPRQFGFLHLPRGQRREHPAGNHRGGRTQGGLSQAACPDATQRMGAPAPRTAQSPEGSIGLIPRAKAAPDLPGQRPG